MACNADFTQAVPADPVEIVILPTLSATTAGGGTVARSPAAAALYPHGTAVRLTAVPAAGNYFALWGNAASGTNNPLSFTITNANPTVTAVFAGLQPNQHVLTVLVDGPGFVSRMPAANPFSSGYIVPLTAFADPKQSFLGWSGDAGGTSPFLTLSMGSSKVITAHFTKRPRLEVFTCGGFLDPANVPLQLHGEPGLVQYIVGSTDLVHWTALATVTPRTG